VLRIEGITVFCVTVAIPFEDRLQDEMQNMRTWLDHQRLQPATFRQSKTGSGIVFRAYFETEKEAAAFATAFGGRVQNATELLA